MWGSKRFSVENKTQLGLCKSEDTTQNWHLAMAACHRWSKTVTEANQQQSSVCFLGEFLESGVKAMPSTGALPSTETTEKDPQTERCYDNKIFTLLHLPKVRMPSKSALFHFSGFPAQIFRGPWWDINTFIKQLRSERCCSDPSANQCGVLHQPVRHGNIALNSSCPEKDPVNETYLSISIYIYLYYIYINIDIAVIDQRYKSLLILTATTCAQIQLSHGLKSLRSWDVSASLVGQGPCSHGSHILFHVIIHPVDSDSQDHCFIMFDSRGEVQLRNFVRYSCRCGSMLSPCRFQITPLLPWQWEKLSGVSVTTRVCVCTICRDVKLLYFYIGVSEPFGDSWCLTTWTYRWFLVSHPMNPLVIPGVSPPEPIGDSWCLTIWTCGDSWCLASTAGGQWISCHPLPNEDGGVRLCKRTCNLNLSVIPGVSPCEPIGDSWCLTTWTIGDSWRLTIWTFWWFLVSHHWT